MHESFENFHSANSVKIYTLYVKDGKESELDGDNIKCLVTFDRTLFGCGRFWIRKG
jgi:hypothetical protein